MALQTVDKPGCPPADIPLSRFTPDSRPPDTVLCFDGAFSDGKYKTWRDFLHDTALLRAALSSSSQGRWILYADDYWYFLTAFTALLQCKKQVLLTANISPGNLAEIFGADGGGGLITDQDTAGSLSIPQVLSAGGAAADSPAPHIPINPIESVLVIYTSGTTGKPKAVPHRLAEFEVDIGFPPEWVDAWKARKNIVTVDPHHLYGFIFSVILPFTLGIPFRRKRIERPEEFERLSDTPYMIITTPAFLKRAVESGVKPAMKEPWIVASGGFLPQETAEKTESLIGFWPIDIYGSTEGSGIAWRQSKTGSEWRPFGSIKVSQNEAGCLVIHLPFPNVPPIPTGDLAEVLSDGTFILQGRSDSIVKIEEKRISLPEVEQRIMDSGLAKAVCVVPMEDKRQYLAAAIVFNDEARVKFAGKEKHEINRFWTEYLLRFFDAVLVPKKWRYIDSFPEDSMGKRRLAEIKALFTGEDGGV
ncbi:MAG: AMP-binding protein [Treponema sp.]|jgi:acyl-coenzyme A synthetase/AMP-(fatty) acid ligase|nr:AMP-binding protein [Treponema sp.]